MSNEMRLLLVEDNLDDCRLIRQLVSEFVHVRYELYHAASWAGAVEFLRGCEFQVVLLDLTLPDAGPLQGLAQVRAAVPSVPIVIVTDLADEELPVAAMQAGAQDYLVKGAFDAALLERRLRCAIGRQQVLLAVKEREERYALALQGANDGIWDWSLSTERICYSTRWLAIIGYQDGELTDKPDEWFSRVHPDDVAQLQAALADHLAGQTACFEAEYRIRHKDDSWRWVLSRGLTQRSPDGSASRMAGTQIDITTRKNALAHSPFGINCDELTGLANRTLLLDRLQQAILRKRRRESMLIGVISLELDRYRMIADNLGLAVGDQLLQAVGERLRACMRAEDTVARIAGDHFVILLEDCRDIRHLVVVAERLQREIGAPFVLEGCELVTTASVGITSSGEAELSPEEFIRDAGIAMNLASRSGGGRYKIFGADMHQEVLSRLQMESELRRGVAGGEFLVHYQPIVDLKTGVIAGFEALLRWQHPRRGLLGPAHFLGILEEAGLLTPVFQALLPDILRRLKHYQAIVPREPPLFMNINLSQAQLLEPGLPELLGRALDELSLPPYSLGVELTESTMVENLERNGPILLGLKARKIRLHMDDFGTGYSSLSSLHRFPIDTLKIDKSFVSRTQVDSEGVEIIRSVVSLARTLGLTTIAEGIETASQLETVRQLKCEFGQGYLLARPMDGETAAALLTSGRPAAPASKEEEPRPECPGRILVVDDDPATLNLLRLQLESEHFLVTTVTNGRACVETARISAPEVILLDMRMPGMDGIATCRQLKQTTETANIPVLFLTGQRDDADATLEALSAGGNDFLSNDTPLPILLARVRCQVAIQRAHANLRRLAMADELTGLFSRRYMLTALRQAVAATSRKRSPELSCLLVDVDHFKRINDSLGHLTGDGVLRTLATSLAKATRQTDMVARFGGEEFVVVLPSTDLMGAMVVAERIRSTVERDCAPNTVSIGVATISPPAVFCSEQPADVDQLVTTLISRADAAMYTAKERGRNCVVAFQQDAQPTPTVVAAESSGQPV